MELCISCMIVHISSQMCAKRLSKLPNSNIIFQNRHILVSKRNTNQYDFTR